MLWNKLDSSLSSRYGAYLRDGVDARLLVSLTYEGDLAGVEAAGFETTYRGAQGFATGKIRLSEIEQIVVAPGVVRISFGQMRRPKLDQSIPLMNARPDVWDWDAAQSKFVPAAASGKGTGKGVVVGIIDTGIDWRHPFFLSQTEPVKVTRILAIWDQGLRPDGDEVAAGPPDAALLSPLTGRHTYGIEYNFARIEAALNNGPGIRHRDCGGHGTHVASIAAGNGGAARTFVGVAPEADIIVVKHLNLQNTPVQSDGTEVGPDLLFFDAVSYILNKAAALNKPVAINYSIGAALGPHDGFTTSEDWLTKEFNTKPRACMVVAAGNEAAANSHAIIEFTGPGTIHLHFRLKDSETNREGYSKCRSEDETPATLDLHLYYPASAAALQFGIREREKGSFQDGPARAPDAFGAATIEGYRVEMWHMVEDQPRPHTLSPNVLRSKFVLQMVGKTDAAGKHPRYHEAEYTLRIEATAAVKAHVWMDSLGDFTHLKLIPPFPPSVTVTDDFVLSSPAGSANVIAVAAYNPDIAAFPTYGFSSHGPLVNYDGPGPHPVEKPDVSAPGEGIRGAASREVHSRSRDRKSAAQVTSKDGTSMAAPHVTGVAALMFEHNPSLTSTDVRNILRTTGNDPVAPSKKLEQGEGRVDAKKAFDAAPTPPPP